MHFFICIVNKGAQKKNKNGINNAFTKEQIN